MIDSVRNIEDRPSELEGQTIKVSTACGNMYVTINSTEKYPIFEVFCTSGKNGSCSAAFVDALTRTISISLRAGVDPNDLINQINSIKCPKSNSKKSCPEAIAKVMTNYLEENYEDILVDFEEFEENIENGEVDTEYSFDINSDVDISYEDDEGEVNTTDNGFEECPECGAEAFDPSASGCSVCFECGFSPC